jgi:hypothetical protein
MYRQLGCLEVLVPLATSLLPQDKVPTQEIRPRVVVMIWLDCHPRNSQDLTLEVCWKFARSSKGAKGACNT